MHNYIDLSIMKNIFLLLLISFTITAFGQQKAVDFKAGEILIQLSKNVTIDDFLTDFNQQNTTLPTVKLKKVTVRRLDMFLLSFDSKKVETTTVLKLFREEPNILTAQLNYRLEMRDSIPDDPLFTDQWSLERIQAPDVWAFSTGGTSFDNEEIVIAVIDSGFDINHEDLQDNIWQNIAEIPDNNLDDDNNGFIDDVVGWNFFESMASHPISSHGTSVSGIVGAKGDNNTGVTGVNWNVKLMLFTARFSEEIAAAYGYVLDQRILYNETNGAQGAFVVTTNASLGISNISCDEQPLWRDMYDPLGEAGVLSVAATTNDRNTDVDIFGDMPTSCESDYLITVTNTNIEEERRGGFGATTIDLGAPGTGSTTVTSTGGSSSYDTNFGGTSAACPHVAGSVGLLFSLPCESFANLVKTQPAQSALLMKQAVLESVDLINAMNGETVTGGRLNLYNSAQFLHSYCVANDGERANNTFQETYIADPGFVRIYASDGTGDRMLIDFSAMNFEPLQMAVYNSIGQVMYKDELKPIAFQSQTFELDVYSWGVGAYFVSILGIDAKVTGKFLKN
ncbi:MAG: subtilisin family serine protease [Saprospiraceae bacterium]|jgi:subtilisin family serine protease